MKRITFIVILLSVFLIASCSKAAMSDSRVLRHMKSVAQPAPTAKITSIGLSESEQAASLALRKSAFNMLDVIYDGETMCFSPLSVQTALAMVAEGTEGKTRKEILDFLGGESMSSVDMVSYCNKYLSGMPALNLNAKMKICNAIVFNSDNCTVNPGYERTMEKSFFAPCVERSFSNPQKVLDLVNDWVSESTEGKIPYILDQVRESDLAYILSTLYFRGAFVYNGFSPRDTQDDIFHTDQGDDLTVKMMNKDGWYCKYFDEEGYQSVSLAFEGGSYELQLILPDEGSSVQETIGRLAQSCHTFAGDEHDYHSVNVSLPTFEVNDARRMEDSLKQLGLTGMFSNGSEINMLNVKDGSPHAFQKVQHNTSFRLIEEGIEGAAVTVVGEISWLNMGGKTYPAIDMKFNRPFIFLLSETGNTNMVLFAGVYAG